MFWLQGGTLFLELFSTSVFSICFFKSAAENIMTHKYSFSLAFILILLTFYYNFNNSLNRFKGIFFQTQFSVLRRSLYTY